MLGGQMTLGGRHCGRPFMVILRYRLPDHCLAVMGMLLLTSCFQAEDSRESAAPGSAASRSSASEELMGYGTEELSQIGNYLPVLDEGRLKAAPPVDWQVASRSQDYVVRFLFDRSRHIPLPRITIGARDVTANEPFNLDRENLVAFVETLMGGMNEASLQALDGRVEPLLLGEIPCARYVVGKKFRFGERTLPARGEVLKTIRDGRVYTVLLDANVNTLVDYRADAYAVMANLRFPLAEALEESQAGAGEGGRQETSREDGAAGKPVPEKEEPAEVERESAAGVLNEENR